MNTRRFLSLCATITLATILPASVTGAHSASDAYMVLDADQSGAAASGATTVIHGQWDIALRDLDFVLRLDDDGDGNINWGELRGHQADIARYAYANLQISANGRACAINPIRQAVSNHADGAYAALFFDIVCEVKAQRLTLDYRLFFAVDPSHRGIFVLRSGGSTATALLSPENAKIDLKL
jgi:hypothetical protein